MKKFKPREVFLKLGRNIRNARETSNMSLRQVSEEVRRKFGVRLGTNYLGKIERGEAKVPLDTLVALARYYNVNPATWVDDTEGADDPELHFFADQDLVVLLKWMQKQRGDKYTIDFLKRNIIAEIVGARPRALRDIIKKIEENV